ncbi:MAG: hypothetical protein MRY79_05445 [Alphaproteobacteria bacterium]|nr:hypothetical protein [Alphaproteobacteria bacterium]
MAPLEETESKLEEITAEIQACGVHLRKIYDDAQTSGNEEGGQDVIAYLEQKGIINESGGLDLSGPLSRPEIKSYKGDVPRAATIRNIYESIIFSLYDDILPPPAEGDRFKALDENQETARKLVRDNEETETDFLTKVSETVREEERKQKMDVKDDTTLDSKLNQAVGDLLVEYGGLSHELQKTIAKIQAYSVHLRNIYDTNIDETPDIIKAFKENGFVKEKDGKTELNITEGLFSEDIRNLPKDLTPEKRAKKIQNIFRAHTEAVHKAIYISLDGFADSQKTAQEKVDARKGTGGKGLSEALPIGLIVKTVDPSINAINDAIFAVHYTIRSGLARILNGKPDKKEATFIAGKELIKEPQENDPDYLHAIYPVAKYLNDLERTSDNPLEEISKEDVSVILENLSKALQDLDKLEFEDAQKKKAVTSIIKDVRNYRNQLAALADDKLSPKLTQEQNEACSAQFNRSEENQDPPSASISVASLTGKNAVEPQEPTAPKTPAPAIVAAENEETQEKNDAQIPPPIPEDQAKDHTPIEEDIEDVKTAAKALNDSPIAQKLLQLYGDDSTKNITHTVQNGSLAWIDSTLEVTQSSEFADSLKNAAGFTNITFTDKEKGHQFKVTKKSLEHIDNNAEFSSREALQMAWIASQNPKMLASGITLTGSIEERAKLAIAIDIINEGLTEGNRLRIIDGDVDSYTKPDTMIQAQSQFEAEIGQDISSQAPFDFKKATGQKSEQPPPAPPEKVPTNKMPNENFPLEKVIQQVEVPSRHNPDVVTSPSKGPS